MPVFTDNANLNKYVAPQVLLAIKETEDNFTKHFGKVNPGARSAEGVNLNLLVNDFTVETGVTVDDKFGDAIKAADKKVIIPWTNFTTHPIRISDTDIRKLTYDKEAAVKTSLIKKINSTLAVDSLHALAPDSDAANTPVVAGTGDVRVAAIKRLTKADLLTLKERYDGDDFVVTLCKQHLADLIYDDLVSPTDKLVLTNLTHGTINMVFGMNFTVNNRLKLYYDTNGAKLPVNHVPGATDRLASPVIEKGNSLFDMYSIGISYEGRLNDFTYKVPHSKIRIYGEFMGQQIQDDIERAVLIDGKV